MDAPFLIKEDQPRPLKVTANTVFTTVKAIIAAGKEEEFLKTCAEEEAFISVEPKFINLAKSFLFSNRMHKMSMAIADVVKSETCTAG